MGTYIDPPDCTKEVWLSQNAIEIFTAPVKMSDVPKDHIPICLVDSGAFTAALVVTNPDELKRARMSPSDTRPRYWFAASLEKLKLIIPDIQTRIDEDTGQKSIPEI